ncbi:MAG: serine/threonine protein kinase [Planctomycetota bacterium]|nr:MAG: serine/threonine protein kinase [Planctomycetota bacterium]
MKRPPQVADNDDEQASEIERLASVFADQLREGRPASIEQYAAAHPALADEIRELFPVILAMEVSKRDRDAPAMRREIPQELSFEKLGDCRLVREIGRGGMGVVFEARRGSNEERVAVKWFPWRMAAMSHWRERFEQEAKTVESLKHPHIVPLLGTGEDDGHPFYVMQFVDGISLDWILKRLSETDLLLFESEIERHRKAPGHSTTDKSRGPNSDMKSAALSIDHANAGSGAQLKGLRRNSWRLFARIAAQAGKAIDHAHRQGVLHNDIKPANLLLDRTGKTWVADFGLARPLDPPDSPEGRGLAGTLRYMAPERFSGWFDELSDLYSLGITLYELVTRRAAFEGADRAALIEAITNVGPLAPRKIDDEIPRDLETIILQAIRRDPDERYYSVEAFVADLARFLNGERIRARRPSRWRKWWGRLFRRRSKRG